MKALLAALALTLAMPLAAHAQGPAPSRGFAHADADGDGKVSYAEFKTMSERVIERRIARQPDSQLAAATPEQRETLIKRRFDNIDSNSDGAIDPTEWANRPHGRSGRQDRS